MLSNADAVNNNVISSTVDNKKMNNKRYSF